MAGPPTAARGGGGDASVLCLLFYGRERGRSAERARASRQLQLAARGLRLRVVPHDPLLEDGSVGLFDVVPPRFPGGASGKARKQLRNDVLTAVAAVLRECTARWPVGVVGAGRGALVAFAASYPRLVEATLALRCAMGGGGHGGRRGRTSGRSRRSDRPPATPSMSTS